MVFDWSEGICPNYNRDGSGVLETSYQDFMDTLSMNDPQYGKENFNKTCFNICATKKEDDTDRGGTYIKDGTCRTCDPDDLEEPDDPEDPMGDTNPRIGTRGNLINAGIYEMCNVDGDDDSGSQMDGDSNPLWFLKQQGANLLGLSMDTENIDLYETNSETSLSSFNDMLSGLQYDSAFESCVNDKLNTPGEDDLEVQTRISTYISIKEFTTKDIHYLKRKLRKIITMKSDQVQECMNLLNLGKSICQTGVADKTLMIGSLIFSIVGNDKIDIMRADNDERYKINKLVDELGPLIPQAVKNIIAISKEYEARVCNVPSNTTLLLERLYNDLYDKPTHVSLDFSPYLDFSSLINMSYNVKFIKTIVVLVVFAFLFMHAANLVIAFLSRGSGKSD